MTVEFPDLGPAKATEKRKRTALETMNVASDFDEIKKKRKKNT